MIAVLRRRMMATHPGADLGFTLVELLISMVLSALAIAVVGGFMLNVLRVQRTAGAVATATSAGSVVARSIEQGIGNASAARAEDLSAAGQLLRARVATGTTAGAITWTCRAWYYSAADGRIFTTSSSIGPVAPPTSAADLMTWTLLASGVAVPTGQPFAPSSAPISVLKLNLSVTAGGSQPVVISTSAQRNVQSDTTGDPATCF